MIKIVPFLKRDLEGIEGIEGMDVNLGEIDYSNSWTMLLIYGQKPIACGGFAEMWSGVAEAWIVAGPEVKKYFLSFYRACKEKLKESQHHRIQVAVRQDFAPGLLLVEKLGFMLEGQMKAYDQEKRDYFRYARIT